MTAALRRLKHVAQIYASNVDKKSIEGDIPVRLCNYVDVYKNNVITDDLEFMPATATSSQVHQFGLRAGDVLITKDSESPDDIGIPAYVPETLDGVVCGYHLSVLRADRRLVDSAFLTWVLRSETARQYFTTRANGITRFALGYSDVGDLLVPVPPVETQRAIVRFLDEETAKIDALIEKKGHVVRLARRVRESQSASVPSASMVPLRRVIKDICDGPFGSNMKTEHYAREGIRVIRLQNIGSGEFLDGDCAYVAREHFQAFSRHEALPGDLLVAGLGDENNHLGRSCLVPSSIGTAMVKADCFRLRLDRSLVLHEYVMHYLNSAPAETQIVWQARGATRLRMNAQGISSLLIPLPPLVAQKKYAEEMSELDTRVAALRIKSEEAARRLVEYRSALITAAVTGQIDVGSAA